MIEKEYPLTAIQHEMLLNSVRVPSSGVEQIIMKLNEFIDIDKFKSAWIELVRNHEVLRTRLKWEGVTQPVQIVESEIDLPFEIHNWKNILPENIETKLESFVKNDLFSDIDLSKAPLLRINIIEKSGGEIICIWSFHHAILDDRSFTRLIKELFSNYDSIIAGKVIVSDNPVPFQKYVEWINQSDTASSKNYWCDLLNGITAPASLTNIPGSNKDIQPKGYLSDTLYLPHDLTDSLTKLSKKIDITLRAIVQGAWALLLYRYSGEEDIVYGNTCACRHSNVIGSENIIGSLKNTIPVRVKIDLDKMLVSWLQEISEQNSSVREYEHISLSTIQQWCNLPKQIPLFESLMVFDEYNLNDILRKQEGDWLNREFHILKKHRFPLTFSCQSGRELSLRLDFSSDRFSEKAIHNMLLQLRAILTAMTEDPNQIVGDIQYIDASEKSKLLSRHNLNDNTATVQHCIHQRFEKQVYITPDSVAVVCEDQKLTYNELNIRANLLASELIKQGVTTGALVGLCVERSLYTIIGILGILKAGGAYVPLDPAYPKERLIFILEDTQSPLLVTQKELVEQLPNNNSKIITIDSSDFCKKQLSSNSCQNLDIEVTPQDLAYVIYTSGSTGKPKGVLIPHQNVIRLFDSTDHWFKFTNEDVWTMFHSYAFDFSVWEIWGALLYGGKLVVIPHKISRSLDLFYETLIREKVTVLNQTPSAFRQLILTDSINDDRNNLKLRYVIFGGEALDLNSLKPWVDVHGDKQPQLINMYGITETTVHVTYREITKDDIEQRLGSVIGKPIPDLELYVLDERLNLVPVGMPGNLFVGGAGLAKAYLNRPQLTEQRFMPHPFRSDTRLYDTGDVVRLLDNDDIEYIGRSDHQVKISGFRIELGEIEAALNEHSDVKTCVVIPFKDQGSDARLAAYWVADRENKPSVSELRNFLKATLPDYMTPAVFIEIDSLPLTENGKLDLRKLPAAQDHQSTTRGHVLSHDLDNILQNLWCFALNLDAIGNNDNFFDCGGTSLIYMAMVTRAKKEYQINISAVDIFEQPTFCKFKDLVKSQNINVPDINLDADSSNNVSDTNNSPIAIIGMSGRFPGAESPLEFWHNLKNKIDSVTDFELSQLDLSEQQVALNNDNYIYARGILNQTDCFDAEFFNVSALEASATDPQQRLFLEESWKALESSGYYPDDNNKIGLFAGSDNNRYYLKNLFPRYGIEGPLGELPTQFVNDKDYLATRTAFKLNLKGPCLSINTACSTSLVAVVEAVKNLRTNSCDIALAGGVSLQNPMNSGYLYQEGGMLSHDGRTRPFSDKCSGTTFNSGVAIVVLKRLNDAKKDGDNIYAVIHGAASNNDGIEKASFTAPSVKGQAAVIDAALKDAGFSADSIDFVETHGTATPLGDPIEIEALSRAFDVNNNTNRNEPCQIGSAKSNVGHLVSAAGTTGLIKAGFALNKRLFPATLHFDSPNPNIDFQNLPFKVCNTNYSFPEIDRPLRAGVSSFGVGGTNAHVVLEEYKMPLLINTDERPRLFVLSAKSEEALERYIRKMSSAIDEMDNKQLQNTAFTMQVSRSFLPCRYFTVAATTEDLLKNLNKSKLSLSNVPEQKSPVVFLFSGQGSQCIGMGGQLYLQQAVYRQHFDNCAELFKPLIKYDLRDVIFANEIEKEVNSQLLLRTEITQPALFAVEYALAKLWISLGLEPETLIGHSIGEYVAAALSGVFAIEDAIKLVAQRGKLMQSMPEGSMLSVKTTQQEIQQHLPDNLEIAAVNAPGFYVVSGETKHIEDFKSLLQDKDINCTLLATSHAFHSRMMQQAAIEFESTFSGISTYKPQIPIVSTKTGVYLSDDEVQSAHYWCQQMLCPVLFGKAINTACETATTFLEIGPGAALTILSKATLSNSVCINSGINGDEQEAESWMKSVGKIWQLGHQLKWKQLYDDNLLRRIPLPTYPFKRDRHWIEQADVTPVTIQNQIINTPMASSACSENNQAISINKSVGKSMSVKELTISELKTTFAELTGDNFNEAGDDDSFLELGLDSLLLTQIVLKLKNNYKLNIPFRRLMQDLDNFELLADYVVEEADPALLSSESPALEAIYEMPVQNTSVAIPDNINSGNMQQLLSQQLQLISQQLSILGGTGVVSSVTTVSTPTPVAQAQEIKKASPIVVKKEKTFGAQTKIELDQNKNKLSDKQQESHDQVINDYLKKTASSKDFTAKHRAILADPRSVSGFTPELKEIVYPIVVKKSKGCRFWDIDDNEYIDTLCGYGSNFFGYSPPFIIDAMKAQLDNGIEIGPQHPLAGEVAELLAELIPLDRFAFCNTGSEAVMGAIRMARTATGRNKIVMFKGSYHGINDEVITRPYGEAGSMPAAAGITPEAVSNTIVLNYDDPKSLQLIEQHKDDIAAVLVESVQSRNPKLQPQLFIKSLRELTQDNDIALIMDEVITGFRLGTGGAQKYFGVKADIATYGKVVGGGISIGIIGGDRKYLDTLDGGHWQYGDDSTPEVGVTYFAGTFVRNPLALAAAKAVLLNVKEKGDEQARDVAQKTEDFAQDMNMFFKYEGVPMEIEYFSSMMYLKFTDDIPYGDLVFCNMRTQGIHIWFGRPMFFTLAHTQDDIDIIKSTFIDSILKIKEMGLLSS